MITKQPPSIHTAFNPIIFEVTDTQPVTMEIISSTFSTTRVRESFNGKAIFDLKGVISKLFFDQQTYIVPSKIFVDYNLFVDYTANVSSPISLTAINAVVQIGKSSDMTGRKGTFLTGFDRIKKYAGYDRVVTAMSYDANTYLGFDGEVVNTTPITQRVVNMHVQDGKAYANVSNTNYFEELRTNTSEIIYNNAGDIIFVRSREGTYLESRLPIDNVCTPEHAFYVRWINRFGGWDYWMFDFRQVYESKISDQVLFNPTVYDQQTAKGFFSQVSMSAEETVTVGSGLLSENEFEELSRIVYAPTIERYKNGKWHTVVIDDFDTEADSRVSSKNIEITFKLPTPQIQY